MDIVSMKRPLKVVGALVGFVCLLAVPIVVEGFQLTLVTQGILLGIFVASVGFLIGGVGLLSFGQALWIGLGGYFGGYILRNWFEDILLATIIVAVVMGLAGGLIGRLLVRVEGLGFAILTLALAQIGFVWAFTASGVTGGDDGYVGIPLGTVLGMSMNSSEARYRFAILVGLACIGTLYYVRRSRFGGSLAAIRENPTRAALVGIPVARYRSWSLGVASAVASVPGVLGASYTGNVSPGGMHWSKSGEALVFTVVGGAASGVGPFMAGFGLYIIRNNVSSLLLDYWEIALGSLMVVAVLAMPAGLAGLFASIMDRLGIRGGTPT